MGSLGCKVAIAAFGGAAVRSKITQIDAFLHSGCPEPGECPDCSLQEQGGGFHRDGLLELCPCSHIVNALGKGWMQRKHRIIL